MVSEIRHIVLEPDEIDQAVREYRGLLRCPLPPGLIKRSKLTSDSEDVYLTLDIVDADTETTCEVRNPDLTTAIIAYCNSLKIPLPFMGIKKLQMYDQKLILVVTMPQPAT